MSSVSLETSGGGAVTVAPEPGAEIKTKLDPILIQTDRFPSFFESTSDDQKATVASTLPLSASTTSAHATHGLATVPLSFKTNGPHVWPFDAQPATPRANASTPRIRRRAHEPTHEVLKNDENHEVARLTKEIEQLKQALTNQIVKYGKLEDDYAGICNKQTETDIKLSVMTAELQSYKNRYEESCAHVANLEKQLRKLQSEKHQEIMELEQEIRRLQSTQEQEILRLQSNPENKYSGSVDGFKATKIINQIEDTGQYRKKFYAQLSAYQRQTKLEREQIHQDMLASIGKMVCDYQDKIKQSEEAETAKIKANCNMFDQALCLLDEDLKKIILPDN